MSDINPLPHFWEAVAVVATIWLGGAAAIAVGCYVWRGRRLALWSLAVTLVAPPAVLAVLLASKS